MKILVCIGCNTRSKVATTVGKSKAIYEIHFDKVIICHLKKNTLKDINSSAKENLDLIKKRLKIHSECIHI